VDLSNGSDAAAAEHAIAMNNSTVGFSADLIPNADNQGGALWRCVHPLVSH
jgi:hypothetical protein